MTLLTYWGRCAACRARLRVFDHEHGNAKTRAGFISKVTQRDDEIAFEDPDGSFRLPALRRSRPDRRSEGDLPDRRRHRRERPARRVGLARCGGSSPRPRHNGEVSDKPAVEDVVDELLAMPPKEFTAARNAAAKQLAADGQREAADEIKGLPRPTLALWSLNRVAHEQADLVETFVDAAAKLRKAHETGGDIRAATPPEREAEARVAAAAAKIAGGQGSATETVMRGIRQALGAAAADPDVAATLSSRPVDPGAGGAVHRPAPRLAAATARRSRRPRRPRRATATRSAVRSRTRSPRRRARRPKREPRVAPRRAPRARRNANGRARRHSPRRPSGRARRRTSGSRSSRGS